MDIDKSRNEKEPRHNEKEEPPEDRHHVVLILFFFLGLVHLLPWSFFQTATRFWMYKFRNTTINETNSEFRTELQAEFNACVTVILQITEVAFLFFGVLFGRFVRVRVRMIGILSIILFFFVMLTSFVEINTDSWQRGFFGLVMLIIAVINSLNAVFTITLYTTVANFPQPYLGSYLMGTGLARVCTSSLQIVSLATGLGVQDSALFYFWAGLAVIIFSLVLVILVTGRNKFYLYHMRNYQSSNEEKHVSFKKGFQLFKKIWPSIAMMGLMVLGMNLSPTTLVVSEGEGTGEWYDVYFIPTVTYFVPAICELIGRWIGFKIAPKIPYFWWPIFSSIRVLVMVPLFIFCNAQPRHHLPVLLPHDYQYIIVTIVMNISGMYLATRASYNIKDMVPPEDLKDAYHVNMVLTGLQMGLLSFISFVAVDLL